jgi:hypothetical protein
MNLPWMIWAFLFSAIGFVYFVYGKKQVVFTPMLIGLSLMIYPYFVSDTVWLVVIGAVLTAIPYFFRNG